MGMNIHTEIDIAAPAERVWEILTDFDDYPQWNPMIPRMRGELVVGAPLRFAITVNRRVNVPITAELVTAEAPHELRWVGPGYSPLRRVLSGSHYFVIEPIDDEHVRFSHGEDFTGLMLLGRWRRVEKALTPIYNALNRAIKRRAEAS